ncbi:MAG: CDP-glycerol glycerophosphotransferase family protein, partial [Atopobiaceae bacterium]|nr:CDP-glycerol glycerophosphotransferase family protein [Atopobiaceae bacterium]
RDDNYVMYVISMDGSTKRQMMMLCGEERAEAADLIECDGYTYDVNRKDTRAAIIVKRKRHFYEKTAQRRKLVEHYVYPVLRLLPLKKKTIVFESYWGRQAGCNPRALYDYIDANHPDYECIWSVEDLRIPVDGKGKRVLTDSLPYFYYMARSRFFVNNVNFGDAYEKRRGQIEIQTMHGTPLKTLGLDVKADFPNEETVKSFLRRCGRWDYLIVQSPKVEEITKSCYAFDRTFLRTGYPRNDELLLRNTEEEQRRLKESMGIDPDTKLVLYAPTWRTSGRFDLLLDFNQLSDAFGDGYTFALRRHHLSMPGFTHKFRMGNAVDLTFEKSIDDVLLATDVLITDYSSLMFDFALLHRPMLFFVYDLEAYRDELRGFNIDLETEAPGPLVRTTKEVITELRNLEGEDTNVSLDSFIQTYLPYETDHSSRDVFEQVIAKNSGNE